MMAHAAVHLHYRRRGLLSRQGHSVGGTRSAPPGPRLHRALAQARSLHQRRSGDDEPVSARRGLRHRRRGGDRPRPRPLRALHRRRLAAQRQHHDGAHLFGRHRARAPRRLSRRHGPGHPPHHGRDQGLHPGGRGGCGLRAVRDRRHGGRHRGPAVPRGDPPARQRARARAKHVRAPDAGALYRELARAQDQADPALGQGAAERRHQARRHPLPQRAADPRERAAQDRPLLQRARGARHPGPRRRHHLRGARCATTPRVSTPRSSSISASGRRASPTSRAGKASSSASASPKAR